MKQLTECVPIGCVDEQGTKKRSDWTRDQLIVAFNLYCRIPFGKIHNRNPEIIALAKVLGRSPSSLSWKLANFASLDPSLKARNIAGASHGSKLEKEVWNEFNEHWEELSFESESLRLSMTSPALIEQDREVFPEGKTRDSLIRARVNQSFFRAAVLASYNSTCCITGLTVNNLLLASHIVPWSLDVENRTNPRNGLCLNAIHDRAFDRGLITVTPEYRVELSPKLRAVKDPAIQTFFLPFDRAEIRVPDRFAPAPEFLKFHNDEIFQA